MELDLLKAPKKSILRNETGGPTWLAKGLHLEELQLSLGREIRRLGIRATELQRLAIARRAERLSAEISTFLNEGKMHLGAKYCSTPSSETSNDDAELDDETDAEVDEDLLERVGGCRPDRARLPLPSKFGRSKCIDLGIDHLADMEIQLRIGQANDVLHAIRLAVAEKATLFRHDVRPASNYTKRTRAWSKIHSVEQSIDASFRVYNKSREAMVKLGADSSILERYQVLRREHLTARTSAINPNARGLRYEGLPWYFSLDIPADKQSSWMAECKLISMLLPLTDNNVVLRVHWLTAKATMNRWAEERELLTAEFEWTTNFFKHCMEEWKVRGMNSKERGRVGASCYAARQSATFGRLAEQTQSSLESIIQSTRSTDVIGQCTDLDNCDSSVPYGASVT